MDERKHLVYEFSGFQLDPARLILLRDGEPVALTHKLFETLMFLVENRGRVLAREELIQALWPESFVGEGNLNQNIFLLRKLLGDEGNGHGFIHTIPRKGYKFIATVVETEAAMPGAGARLSDYWSRHSPFRSLQVFEPEDAWLFFGRDAEADDLLRRLGRSPVLVLVGNSGSGKSSLVRAGLIPALRAGRFCHEGSPAPSNKPVESSLIDSWRIALLRPSAAPFDYLAEVLPSQLAPELSPREQADFIAHCRSQLGEGGDALRNAISALAHAATDKTDKAGQTRILLVVDQFEEIFTLTGQQGVRDRYIHGLLAAAHLDSAVPVHLVLALRADFYGHCLEHPGLSRCLETNLYNVPRMTPEQLRETIERRLRLADGRAEPGLIDSLLEDVGAEPGNLALLEHALGQLWERCGGPGCTLTNRAYAEIGRLRGALGRHADEVYAGLGDESQERLAQKIFLELVHLGEGAQDTRRRVAKAELLGLGKPEEVEALLARLASSRLIATGRAGEETFVEVSHEALIREWPALREWVTQNREELRLERRLLQAAEEWQSLNRDRGALLQGARLAQAEDWLSRHTDAPALMRQFVQASVAARAEAAAKEREAQERELAQQKAAAVLARRSAARLRWFAGALTVMLLVAAGSAWFAYHQWVLETSRALAAQSGELLSRDRGQALDLAIRSWRTANTEEAHLAVAKAFPELLATLKHEGPIIKTVFSPDGQRILSVSYDNTARVWNADDGRLLATLRGHRDKLTNGEFSPDGLRIVTASFDHTARIWNAADGHLLATLQGHTDTVFQAKFSPDGQRIVTASFDHTARVWNSADGKLLAPLNGHSDKVVDIAISPDGQHIVTSGLDRVARIWNSSDGHLEATLQGHTLGLTCVKFSPDGRRILTMSFDKTARVWSSPQGHLLAILQHDGPIESGDFSKSGNFIVTASHDHTARVWNSRDGRLLFALRHDGPVQHAEFSADSRHIVTASYDQTARVWNVADGRLLAMLHGHTAVVYHAAFSASGERIVTGSGDGTVRIWNTAAGLSLNILQGHTSPVYSAKFSGDGRRVATASADRTARVWDSGDGRSLAALKGHSDVVWRAEFSPDGQRIVTTGNDRTPRVWNAADGRLLATLQGHTDLTSRAQFSPDGQRIVTASYDHTARVWNSTDGRLLATLRGHTDRVWNAQFSRDGQRIVTAGKDHTARLWNATDGSLLLTLQGHTKPVWVAQFSSDGQRVVTASLDKTVRVWNAADGRLHFTFTLQGCTDELSGLEVSPDDQRIVTTCKDHMARLWNVADGRLVAVLQGHTDRIARAEFSADSQRIVTASYDNTARVWNSNDGRLTAILQGHTGELWQATFSPDGRRIVTASVDQTTRIWQVLTLDDIERILAK